MNALLAETELGGVRVAISCSHDWMIIDVPIEWLFIRPSNHLLFLL